LKVLSGGGGQRQLMMMVARMHEPRLRQVHTLAEGG
jgi:hypothetical protein